MTESTAATPNTDLRFASVLAEAVRSAVTGRSGQSWEGHMTLPPEAEAAGDSTVERVSLLLELQGGLAGRLYLDLERSGVDMLLADRKGVLPEDAPRAWLETVTSSTSSLARGLSSLFRETTVKDCQLAAVPAQAAFMGLIAMRAADDRRSAVEIRIDEDLRASLRRAPQRDLAGPVSRGGTREEFEDPGGAKLHRVIDVPLHVTLRFGQRQLTLRELLDLSTGSLVELDRQVEEPVELMLGERIVARGEVVIVDGNYGMRVTEVVENVAQRLASPGAV